MNERLIEETLTRVKRDLVEAEHEGGDAWVTTADLRMLLAVFEKAHTPTDDERLKALQARLRHTMGGA